MKKIISLVIAVMMLVGMVACAQAAESPSVPKPSVTVPSPTVDTPVAFVLEQVETTDNADAVQAKLVEAAAEGKLVEFFGEAAVAALPEGVDLTTAQVDEFIPMVIANYSFVYGDVKATIECVTEYQAGDKLVAMLGSVNGDTVTWYPLEAEVDAEGKVVVTFTEEVLLAVTGTEVVLALIRVA